MSQQHNLSVGLLKQANHDLKTTGFGDQGFWLGYNQQKLAHAIEDREEAMMKQAREMPKEKKKEQSSGINPLLLGLGGLGAAGGLGYAGHQGYLGEAIQNMLGGGSGDMRSPQAMGDDYFHNPKSTSIGGQFYREDIPNPIRDLVDKAQGQASSSVGGMANWLSSLLPSADQQVENLTGEAMEPTVR